MNAKRSVLEKRGLPLGFTAGCPRLFGFLPLLTKVFAVAAMLFLAVPAHAAISYVGVGAIASSTGSNNRSLVVPTIVNDDLLIAHVAIRGNRTITPPAGWTLIDQVYVSNARITQGIYYKVGLASDSGTTVTWNFSNSDDNAGVIRAYRGVDTTTPIGNFSGNINGGNASATLTALSITTTIANEWIATFYGVADGAANPVTTPVGMAERYDFDNGGGGNGLSLAGDDEARPTAGATGNRVSTSSQSDRYVAQLVALKPISLPVVISIGLASSDPTSPATVVSWTVDFNTSVTGVDSTDFALVQAGGVTGATITSVTGSGTSWTVTANTGSGTGTLGLDLVDNDSIIDAGSVPLGGAGAGNGDFTGQVYTVSPPFCSPPSNIPAGVTVSCVCDQFGRASLNPSTIYGANWIVSKSDSTVVVPYINATTGYLRLTENTGNNAKAATVPGIFPAAGNYISVEFQHFAYGGSGADGIAVTLSDYAVTAVPGAFGGSLGYAQKTGASCPTPPCDGFAGGWIGVGIDEFGNYQNPTEGRIGGPGVRVDSVGVRGSGSGSTGYNWMAGTATLAPGIDNTGSATPAPGYYYQVIVDARNDPTSTSVTVNRDTGAGYTSLINVPNVYTAAAAQGFTQSPVPPNWQISFTGSTGGSTNIHEIGGLRICAQTVAPPSGGTASGFNAIDEAYGTPPSGPAVQSFLNGHIYMKVAGLHFKLNVAALNNNQIVTTYAAGGNKNVTVNLVDNSNGACVLDSTQANYCNNTTCTTKTAVAGGSQTMTFVSGDSGKKQSANFTLNSAYKNLVAIMSDGTTTACSTDAFSVRPPSVDSVTSSPAPTIKAGVAFTLTAATNTSGYTGVLKINTSAVQVPVGAVTGALAPTSFPAASGTPPTASGNTFTYSEVGTFDFLGYPTTNTTSPRGVYDGVATATECAAPVTPAQCDILRAATWMGIDSVTSKGDCVQNNYSNITDANGKYGCSFGIDKNYTIGRFTPAYFDVTKIDGCTGGGAFTYSGQPFSQVQVKAKAVGGTDTKNYDGVTLGFAKAVDLSDGNGATAGTFGYGTFAAAGFANGVQIKTNVSYTFTAKETPSLTLKLRATESPGGDGVSSNYAGATEDNAAIRSGRINVYNAYGSELVDLYVPMQAEYYEDTTVTLPATNPPVTGWVANTSDTCSAVKLKALSSFQGNLTAAMTCVQDTGSPGVSNQGCASAGPAGEQYRTLPKVSGSPPPPLGSYNLYLQKPGSGNTGSADLSADLSTQPWLRFDWTGAGNADPVGRASFGLYRGSPRHIYLRER